MSDPAPMTPLRILHLTAGSDAGGLSRYIFDLCSAMHARGHEVAVAGERGAWHTLFADAPFPWIDVPLKGNPLTLRAAARTLERWMAQHPVDILHTHYRRTTLVARKLQRHGGGQRMPPVLYTVHLSDMSLRWPWRMLTDFGDHTHVPAVDAQRWVVDEGRLPAGRVTLIPHGVDAMRFPLADDSTRRAARAALNVPADARVAAYVGRLDRPKNEDWLLDVVARMPELHLVIAGDGPNEGAVRQRIAREGLGSRVHLLGHRDPLAVYQAADASLLASLREGFSLTCAEAMSVGVPVLRTRTAGSSELILEGITGRSVPIERDAFVRAAVDFLSLDTPTLRRMGAAAAQHVRQNFTFDLQLARTIDLYRTLACKR